MLLPEFSEYFSGEAGEYLDSLLKLALAEDGQDLSSEGVFSSQDKLQAIIVAKERTHISGFPVIPLVMELCTLYSPSSEKKFSWEQLADEGEIVNPGHVVAKISGSARAILKAERVILNFVSHLSGIANLTANYVKQLENTGVRLLDTRKTLPGLRYPDKYAVLCGGGHNHRRNLAEMLMLKDNHIDAAGSMTNAVAALRKHYSPCPPIEVECRNEEEIREAVACRVERIMLDNMTQDMLPAALALIPSSIETEISGGITLENIRSYATASTRRPDFISVGRLTHSAVAADFSMRITKDASL